MTFIRRAPKPGPNEITLGQAAKQLTPVFIGIGLKLAVFYAFRSYARKALEEHQKTQEQ